MPEVTLVPKESLPEAVGTFIKSSEYTNWDLLPKLIPAVKDLDREILHAVETGGGFNMGGWHSKCGTTHCIAGWAITLAGENGHALESEVGDTEDAAHLIYAASGCYPPPSFFPTEYSGDAEPFDIETVNARALDALRARVAAREAQP